jgi:hypothetical protein
VRSRVQEFGDSKIGRHQFRFFHQSIFKNQIRLIQSHLAKIRRIFEQATAGRVSRPQGMHDVLYVTAYPLQYLLCPRALPLRDAARRGPSWVM